MCVSVTGRMVNTVGFAGASVLSLCLYSFFFMYNYPYLVAQLVRNLPSMQETGVQFLGWEEPLEKEMATHSSVLAWKIPWTEEPGRLRGVTKVRAAKHTSHTL